MISGNRVFPMPNVVFFAVTIPVSFKFLNVINTMTIYLFHFLCKSCPQTKLYDHHGKIANCSKELCLS